MSFLTGIYSKVWGSNAKKATDQASSDGLTGTGFSEHYDNEDDFVLYTAEQNKRHKQSTSTSLVGNYVCENFQQSSPYPPTVTTSHMLPGTTVGGKSIQKRDATFLTVSDLPMQMSKQLQVMLHINQGIADVARRSPPNIDQYHYDFILERDVIQSAETAQVE